MSDVYVRLRSLLLVVAGSVVVFMANYLFFVQTTLGQELDDAALIGGELRPQGVVSEAWELLDVISVVSLAAACVAIGVVALLRRRFALAVAVLAAIGIANVVTQLLKRVVLERPDLIGTGDLNSLPSGHATVAATVAVGMVVVSAPRWRSVVALVAWLFPIAVGVAVVIAGWHRPSDSIAAFCVVLGVTAAALACVVAVFGFDHGERPPAWFRRSVLTIVGVVIAVLVALSFAGLWLVRDQLRDGELSARWDSVAFASAAAAIIAGAGLMLLLLVATVREMAIGHGGWHRDDGVESDAPVGADAP
jgi:membrane-associated phospholipid phosphatase